ncbi:hypothetical protein SVAN01_04925 [Stagonosporopsis vannaccii]|nr:hypothetical protein SVAN01_04925 [Stagonosporopsis vannaccii]
MASWRLRVPVQPPRSLPRRPRPSPTVQRIAIETFGIRVFEFITRLLICRVLSCVGRFVARLDEKFWTRLLNWAMATPRSLLVSLEITFLDVVKSHLPALKTFAKVVVELRLQARDFAPENRAGHARLDHLTQGKADGGE